MWFTQPRFGRVLLLVWSLALTSPAGATTADIESPGKITAAAKAFLERAAQEQHTGRIQVKMGRLDPRLRLTACNVPLEAFQPAGARSSGHTSVGVRCPGPATWSIYLSADIDVFAKALVVTRPLARDAALETGDVQLVETEVSALGQGYLQAPEDIEGMVTRRPINAGTVLIPAMIKAPHIVKRGDRVRLQSGQGPIQVEMMGEAINNGARGERVRVRALNSKRVVEGWVVSASVVKMTP